MDLQGAPEPGVVVGLLAGRGETLAVAESFTGGLLAATIVDVPGASAVFRGGLVVYATDLKASLAGVSPQLLAAHGPVDPQVAQALADGARRVCGADWALSTTGVAGPQAQGEAPVGTVYLGLAGPGGQRRVQRLTLTGGRGQIRHDAVREALRLLHAVLLG